MKLINFSKRKCRWKSNFKKVSINIRWKIKKLMPDTAKEKQLSLFPGSRTLIIKPMLNSIELTINEGECVVIVGPSGGGKTTLLNILNSHQAKNCKVIIQGKDLTNYTPESSKCSFKNFSSSKLGTG